MTVQVSLALSKCAAAPSGSTLERNDRHHGCRDADANDGAQDAALLRMGRRVTLRLRLTLCYVCGWRHLFRLKIAPVRVPRTLRGALDPRD